MEIEWDTIKAEENLRKHGVDFADAVIALEDLSALTIENRDHEELCFKTLEMGPELHVLFVAHCARSANHIRIISAREADKKETKDYFRGLSYE